MCLCARSSWDGLSHEEIAFSSYADFLFQLVRSQLVGSTRLIRVALCCAVTIIVQLLCVLPAQCQVPNADQPDSDPEASAPPAETAVREVEPRVFYLLDNKGKPIWVPNFSFEQWQRWFEQDQRLRDPVTPPFVHQRTTVVARVVEDVASVSAELQVRLVATDRQLSNQQKANRWTRIPLGLVEGALQQLPVYAGVGNQFVTRSPVDGQLVAWVKAAADSVHTWKFELKVPVVHKANDSQLRLSVPPAVEFTARLRVPGTRVLGSVEGGASVLRSTREVDGDTEFLFEGRSGLSVAWRSPGEKQSLLPARLDVRARIRVTVEGPDYVTSRADLTVRSFSGDYRSFLVRLPPGMELLSHSEQRGYTIEALPADQSPDQAFQYAQVSLQNKAPEDGLNFWLLAVMQRDREGQEENQEVDAVEVEMAGFDVPQAVRQRGQIDFAVNGDWTLNWRHDRAVRRVTPRVDADGATRLVAQFLYHQFPYQLSMAVREKTRDVRVEPKLELDVQPARLEFVALLDYQVRGARTSELTIDVGAWQVDQVGPEEIVLEHQLADGRLQIQLTPAAIDLDQFSIRLSGYQEMPEESPLEVELPVPLERTVNPTQVTVQTARNLELVPITERIVGLVPLAALAGTNPEPRDELLFRQDMSARSMRFAADFQIRERQVAVELATSVGVEAGQLRVQRRANYQVTFGALTEIALQVPAVIFDEPLARFEIWADGEKLPAPVSESVSPGSAETALVEVLLPREVFDRTRILVEYTIPLPSIASDGQVDVAVPLVAPVVGDGGAISLAPSFLQCEDALEVQIPGEDLVVSARSSLEGKREFELPIAVADLPQIKLAIRRAETGRGIPMIVKQTWLQTWITSEHYWNRMSVRVETRQSRIQVRFPEGADLGPVAINQQPVQGAALEPSGLLDVSLEPLSAEHLLEVWYSLPLDSVQGRRRVAAPQIDGVTRFGRSYWQLVTPANQHLTWSSDALSEESHWHWTGWGWRREELRDQQALERWIGASEQDALPVDTNRYLFATVGAVRELDCLTLSRHLLLLLGSGGILAVGLLMVYFKRLRHPALLVFAGAILVGLAGWVPDLALLLGQAAATGLLLVALAQLLHIAVWRRSTPSTTEKPHGDGVGLEGAGLPDVIPVPGTTATATVPGMQLEAKS